VPAWVLDELLENARTAARNRPAEGDAHDVTRGTLISRFSFTIDVNEWGFHDQREELIRRMEKHPAVTALVASEVWDERASADEKANDDPEEGDG
jgi:hypothetical protein